MAGEAAVHLAIARRFDEAATAEGSMLTLSLRNAERDVPELVRALVAGGAAILEVHQETPDLEDVYLHLVGSDGMLRSDVRS